MELLLLQDTKGNPLKGSLDTLKNAVARGDEIVLHIEGSTYEETISFNTVFSSP